MKTRILSLILALVAIVMGAKADDDMRSTPLTIEAMDKTVEVSIQNDLGLSFIFRLNNGGTNATLPTLNPVLFEIQPGQKLELWGNNDFYYHYDVKADITYNTTITCSDECYVYGNVMSLINSTSFSTMTELPTYYYKEGDKDIWGNFSFLFDHNTNIYNHPTKDILLPATTLSPYCYQSMFYKCENLRRAPVLPAPTLTKMCYNSMFYLCTSLEDVRCYATEMKSGDDATKYWLGNVKSKGTFYKHHAMGNWEKGENGIPSGWTVLDVWSNGLSFAEDEVTFKYTDALVGPTLNNPHSLPVFYSSSVPSVATVDAETGALALVGLGETKITVSYIGSDYLPDPVSYTLKITGEPAGVEFSESEVYQLFGDPFTAPTLTNPHGLDIIYYSSDMSVATVDVSTGEVTIVGTGTTNISAFANGKDFIESDYTSYKLTVFDNIFDVNKNRMKVRLDDCITLINDAKKEIDALTYDNGKTPEENQKAIDNIIAKLINTLAKQFNLVGDVDGDGTLDVNDVQMLIDKILGKIK